MDILWSCLFTIITCTWTVQHLNVPEQREDRNPSKWGTIWWAIKRAWTSAKWMLITVLAPEILLAKNVGGLTAVKLDLEKLQDWAAQDGVPWTKTHSLFANMGGFVIRRISSERAVTTTFPETGTAMQEPIPRTIKATGWKAKLRRRIGWKSKSDGLMRAITVVQITWMVIQIIVRAFPPL